MIDKFSSSPESRLKKINSVLKRQFGMVIKADADMETLSNLRDNINESIHNLKVNGRDSKTDPELSKNLLIAEGISAVIEHKQLNEYDDHMSNRYQKVVDWLSDYAFKNVELGDEFDEAMAEAMKQYRSSKYRFDDVSMQHDVRKNVVRRLKDAQMNEDDGGGFELEQGGSDPWVAARHVEKPKDPATDPATLRAIRAKYENASEGKVAEMKSNYVKQLRMILENEEVQQAEVIVAAKSFSTQLQEIIQKIGRMQNEDMGKVVDQMNQVYGPEMAMTFQQELHSELDQILQELRQTKAQIEQAVEGMTNDQAMGMDMTGGGMDDGMGDELGMDDGMDGGLGDQMGMDDGMGGDVDAELDGIEDELGGVDAAAMDDEPLGRAAKESVQHNLINQISEMKRQIAELKALKEGRSAKK